MENGYLAIGHVTQDLTPAGSVPGGTALFAALTARALGEEPSILTSLGPGADLGPLASVAMHVVPAGCSTTFENRQTDNGRVQRIRGVAARLEVAAAARLAAERPAVVHLGPVADEVDPAIAALFPDAIVGVTPQGWMREWDASGLVGRKRWVAPAALAARARAAVFSSEDVGGDEGAIDLVARAFAVTVVTEGARGARLLVRGRAPVHVPAPPRNEVDPTGAGDIFAAAFFISLARGASPIAAAEAATLLAADSVTHQGVAWLLDREGP